MTKTKIILFLAIAAYTIYFSWLTISRHYYGFSGRFDLGNMEQTVWNTSEGRIFQMTNPSTSKISSRLAFHADFLLMLIAPIYKLFPGTETLLIIQALVVALGAIPVYLIAKHIFVGGDLAVSPHADKPEGLSAHNFFPFFFAILYLLSPVIERANIYEFHSEVLAVTFLLFTFYFLLIGKTKSFLLFFFLSLISKETVSLTLAMICIFGIVKNKKRGLCLFLLIICVTYFLLMVRKIIPTVNGVTNRHFALGQFTEGDEKFFDIIAGYIKHPFDFIKNLTDKHALQYYLGVLSYGGFTFLFSPLTFIFCLPALMINTLAKGSQFQSLSYQYSATTVPGLMISTIYGFHFLRKKLKDNQPVLISILSIISLISLINLYQYSPLPYLGQKPYLDFQRSAYPAAKKIHEWAAKIPSDKSVSATNNVGSHFAKRQNLYAFPNKIGEADNVIIAAKSWQEWMTDAERNEIIRELKNNSEYKLLDEAPDFWLFQKTK